MWCSTEASCSFKGPRWLIYPILSCKFKLIFYTLYVIHAFPQGVEYKIGLITGYWTLIEMSTLP